MNFVSRAYELYRDYVEKLNTLRQNEKSKLFALYDVCKELCLVRTPNGSILWPSIVPLQFPIPPHHPNGHGILFRREKYKIWSTPVFIVGYTPYVGNKGGYFVGIPKHSMLVWRLQEYDSFTDMEFNYVMECLAQKLFAVVKYLWCTSLDPHDGFLTNGVCCCTSTTPVMIIWAWVLRLLFLIIFLLCIALILLFTIGLLILSEWNHRNSICSSVFHDTHNFVRW